MSLCAKTPHQLSKTDDSKFYFFLPLALPLPAEPVEVTLLARDVAGEALPLTVSSCLFCALSVMLAMLAWCCTDLDAILGLLLDRLFLLLFVPLLDVLQLKLVGASDPFFLIILGLGPRSCISRIRVRRGTLGAAQRRVISAIREIRNKETQQRPSRNVINIMAVILSARDGN